MRDGMYATYRMESERARKVVADDPGLSTEGGMVVGYYRQNGTLFLADMELLGEGGRLECSLVCDSGMLIVAKEHWHLYNRPFYWDEAAAKENGDDEFFDPAKTEVRERTVYFNGSNVVCIEYAGPDDQFWPHPEQLMDMLDRVEAILKEADTTGTKEEEWKPAPFMGPGAPLVTDTALCGVGLCDAASAVKVLGSWQGSLAETQQEPFPHASFRLEGDRGSAVFVLHYGSGIDQYAEMCLSRAEADTVFGVLPASIARSSAGIRLGMSLEEALTALGPSTTIGTAPNDHRLVRYAITDPGSSDLLRGYGMPAYYMALEFGPEGLVEYRFGFEYP